MSYPTAPDGFIKQAFLSETPISASVQTANPASLVWF